MKAHLLRYLLLLLLLGGPCAIIAQQIQPTTNSSKVSPTLFQVTFGPETPPIDLYIDSHAISNELGEMVVGPLENPRDWLINQLREMQASTDLSGFTLKEDQNSLEIDPGSRPGTAVRASFISQLKSANH